MAWFMLVNEYGVCFVKYLIYFIEVIERAVDIKVFVIELVFVNFSLSFITHFQ